jgi:hypothetical protein
LTTTTIPIQESKITELSVSPASFQTPQTVKVECKALRGENDKRTLHLDIRMNDPRGKEILDSGNLGNDKLEVTHYITSSYFTEGGDYKVICNLRETVLGIDPLIDSKNAIVKYSPLPSTTTSTTILTTTTRITTTTIVTTTTQTTTTRVTTTQLTTTTGVITTIPTTPTTQKSCPYGCFMGSGGCVVYCQRLGYSYGVCEFPGDEYGCNPRDCCCFCEGSSATTTQAPTTTKLTTTTSGGGGEGCPILKVFNGKDFVIIEKLNIHAPEGKDTKYTSKFSMKPKDGKYEITLEEAAYLFWDGSHIDYVKLTDENGKECKLISAMHSKNGDVLSQLIESDDVRVRTFPKEEIKLVFNECSGDNFTFTIEGYNPVAVIIKSNPIESILSFFKSIFGIE